MSVVSDSVRPHRWQPNRLPHPWDSPGKNTGVGCHFLLQVKSESEVTQSCPALRDPMDCSLPGFSVHGIFWYWSGVPLPSPYLMMRRDLSLFCCNAMDSESPGCYFLVCFSSVTSYRSCMGFKLRGNNYFW